MGLPQALERYRAEIDAELRSVLAGYRLPMYDMLRYHLGWQDEQGNPLPGPAGKAVRPALCLLACEATAHTCNQALPAAAALELAHNYSLIHDDVQDDDRERRHRPTVWSIWGKPQAINAGTAMWVLANLATTRLAGRGVSAQKQLHVLYLLNDTCQKLLEGQYLDISYEGRLDVSVDDYLAMIERKTAALIARSLEIGALLGSDDAHVVRAFARFGRHLGLAFQIRDDLLGIWGDPAVTGKPAASDIRRRKKTFPIVFALERAGGPAREALARLYQAEAIDEAGVAAVRNLLEEVGARQQTARAAAEHASSALAELDRLVLSPWARRSLEEVARFLAERGF